VPRSRRSTLTILASASAGAILGVAGWDVYLELNAHHVPCRSVDQLPIKAVEKSFNNRLDYRELVAGGHHVQFIKRVNGTHVLLTSPVG